jgi:single-strand DNA-binding protein
MGKDPELRFSASGTAVARFSVVTSKRQKNRTTQEWEDIDVTWWDCSAFNTLAENLAETMAKGHDVIVVGRVVQKTWEGKDGSKQSRLEMLVDSIGPDLRRATAKVAKATRAGFQPDRQHGGGTQAGRQGSGWGSQPGPSDDPWASSAPSGGGQGGGWGASSGGGYPEEPPF